VRSSPWSAIASGVSTYYARDNAGTLIGERIGGSSYYYLFDGLGSVVAVTGSAGTALDTYTYDPYGQVTPGGSNSVANPWQYTGGYRDAATGLVKLGQRFDDPTLGRWTQRDPVPQGNRYIYAGDNSVNFTDPSGLFTIPNIIKQTLSYGVGTGLAVGTFEGAAALVATKSPAAAGLAFGTGFAEGFVLGSVGYLGYRGTLAVLNRIG